MPTSDAPGLRFPVERLPLLPLLPVVPLLPLVPLPPVEVAPRRRRRRRGGKGAGGDTLFIYVPGHGGDPEGFRDLQTRIGIRPDRVRVFDWRSAGPWDDRVRASMWIPVDDAASALEALVRREATRNRRIYLVGHSKGGAVVTELIADWDERRDARSAVVGAALLDPAISAGWLGTLQRSGDVIGPVPDNGGFDPVRCDARGCRDVREHLGAAAGVPVVVIRDPAALVTNFHDRPDGLRVHDVPDRLPLWTWSLAPIERMGLAHRSMLHDDATARCIADEARHPGSCRWPGEPAASPRWGVGRGGAAPWVE